MVVFVVVVLVLLVGVLAAVVVGWRGGLSIGMPEPTSTMGFAGLESEELTSQAVAQVRFDRVFRGYRMDQVDAVLDLVRADLAEREAALAELTSAAGGGFPVLSFPDDLSGLGDGLADDDATWRLLDDTGPDLRDDESHEESDDDRDDEPDDGAGRAGRNERR
ncbi:MAG TPA: DivIVA domain-containing protein [Dermatophilaceae bacterium]|nr:DivIVA domain-containing protein [Dermatophilaceae bacterium]